MENIQSTELTPHVTSFENSGLYSIFFPKSVAVIGATENPGTVGRTVLWNLITSPFGAPVYPVNPKRSNVLGVKAYPSIKAIGEPVELAVIVTPAGSVPALMRECVEVGVKGVIVISAGFKETGSEGAELERQVIEEARKGGIRVIGPNCLGIMNPINGLNATFATTIAKRGKVGFISQSGALCTAVLDWSLGENVGFSSFISIGSMADVGWGDLIYFLGSDPNTESIVIYMETIGDAKAFMSAAREIALSKPIILIKPGRTSAAAKAAASHTGSLTGSDDVLDIAFQRAGVLRVNNISDLFNMSDILAKQPRPKGPRMTMVTNAGGPGVLATDALIMHGGKLAELRPDTMEALNKILPFAWSHNNPVDVLGDASPERYAKAVEIVAKDPNTDGLLVVLTPQAMTDPVKTAEEIKQYANLGKPVLSSWMGGDVSEDGRSILSKAGIPSFKYPDTAAKMFDYMWQYSQNLKSLYETPSVSAIAGGVENNTQQASELIEKSYQAGKTILTEHESKQVLGAYNIPTVPTIIATSEEEAVTAAGQIGFPIVLKLHSEVLTHKTDVGGVKLNLKDAAAVKAAFGEIRSSVESKVGKDSPEGMPYFAGVTVQPMIKLEGYELILGSNVDPQFGPVLLFGTGGQLVEVFQDRALGLPPLNTTLARRMMEKTKIYKALKGVRGRKSVNLDALQQLMVNFSQLVAEQPLIKEIDINPVLASEEQLIALDARIVLFDINKEPEERSRLVIRPYPTQYVRKVKTKGGEDVKIRPIKPEDEPLYVKFQENLSEQSVLLRYMKPVDLKERVEHEYSMRQCFVDYDREIAIVAERLDATTKKPEIIGMARLVKVPGRTIGQLNIVIADAYQQQGIGAEFMKLLIEFAKAEKLTAVVAVILAEDKKMPALCKKHGFQVTKIGGEFVTAELKLEG